MIRSILALLFFLCGLFAQNGARDYINEGVRAFKAGEYSQAVAVFRAAITVEPANVTAHLYLGSAYAAQSFTGSADSRTTEFATLAESEYQQVLRLDPGNLTALRYLASLTFNQKRLDASKEWYEKILAVDPNDATTYYSLGVIAWSKFYPELTAARKLMGMRPEDPGPLRNAGLRFELREKFSDTIAEGLTDLRKALEINPQYSDAMAYTNLLIRERADLLDNPQEYAAEIAKADDWVQRALAAKRLQAPSSSSIAPPPPPPPPPGTWTNGDQSQPTRIRVGGNVQAANLIRKPTPAYPPLAFQARIQGTVRFQAVISKEGQILNLQLVSGHPLLVPSATEAVKQYQYKPTLLNGQPVEVMTQIDVPFQLDQ